MINTIELILAIVLFFLFFFWGGGYSTLVIALTCPDQSQTLESQVSAPSVPTPTEEMRGSMEFGLGRKGINAGWNFARLG